MMGVCYALAACAKSRARRAYGNMRAADFAILRSSAGDDTE
jgi:hypothetical protein